MGFTKGFWKGEDDLKERERERCQWVATQDFSFLWKTKWEREAYIIFFSLCGRKEWRKEGRKGCCTADTRFCVQSASNLIRLFLGTLLTRRSLLILFDCFSLSLSRYIYIYDPPLNSFFVCMFVGSPFLLALPFREETLGCIQVRAKIWCPHILGSVEVQYRNISGMPEQSTWVSPCVSNFSMLEIFHH